jgi:hypothetical protein
MSTTRIKLVLATAAVAAGLLAAAGSASAATYQHNQTNLEFLAFDGTSNTIAFGE